jgi:hypothetical protein
MCVYVLVVVLVVVLELFVVEVALANSWAAAIQLVVLSGFAVERHGFFCI